MPDRAMPPTHLHSASELRQLWKPLRDSYAAAHLYEHTRVRIHRAFTWLEAAERAAGQDAATSLIDSWSGLMALASQWDDSSNAPIPAAAALGSFMERLRAIDHDGVLATLARQRDAAIQAIIDDDYVAELGLRPPAPVPGAPGAPGALDPDRLDRALTVIHVVWRQLTEGGTAHGSAPIRRVVERCARVAFDVALAAVNIVTCHGYAEEWGPLCFPPPREARSTSMTAWSLLAGLGVTGLLGATAAAGAVALAGDVASAAAPAEASWGSGALDAWLTLAGRMHPFLIHFPVALVLVAFAAELWRLVTRRAGPSPITIPLVAIAACGAVAAAATGWLFAASGGEDGDWTLWLHRWGGTLCAVQLLGVWWLARRTVREPGPTRRFRAALAVGATLIAGVGHFGGELVYGDGFVESALDSAISRTFGLASPSSASGGVVSDFGTGSAPDLANVSFARDVQPILEDRCVECHGTRKKKAGLSFTPIESALAWVPERIGDNPAIAPGDPEQSEVMHLVTLPESDEDAMPPEGARLTAGQIATIRAWIEQGAKVN